MKKKVLALLLALLVLPISLFAAVSGSWNGSALTTDSKAGVKATFNMDSDTITDQMYIGFTKDNTLSSGSFSVTSEQPSAIDSDGITLQDKDGDGKASNKESDQVTDVLNVYYQITSANKIVVYLSLDKPMENSGNYLGWNVSWDGSVQLSKAGTDTTESVVKKDVHTHDGTSKIGSAGFKTLTVETEDYRNSTAGSYVGYIYVTVESGGN